MPNYALGKIYRVVSTVDNKIYIGSSAQKYLSMRMGLHRAQASAGQPTPLHKAMRDHGIEKFSIVLEKAFPCNSRAELEAEEYRVMQTYLQNGTEIYNTRQRQVVKPPVAHGKRDKFKYGMIGCYTDGAGRKAWKFFHKEEKLVGKSWSCKKYGFWEAKRLAEAERKRVYPQWVPEDEEADAIAELGGISWDA